jgi:hypothetical protein
VRCDDLVKCVFRSVSCPCEFASRCGPYLPFYSFQGEGSGYISTKKVKWEKMKEKKGGLGCGHFPPYPVGAVSPVAQRCYGR